MCKVKDGLKKKKKESKIENGWKLRGLQVWKEWHEWSLANWRLRERGPCLWEVSHLKISFMKMDTISCFLFFLISYFILSTSTSWPAHVQQTVWASPGIVRRAPHHCVQPLPPRGAPRGADSVHTGPGRVRSQWPHPPYRGSQGPAMLPWKSCQCFEI